jgi:hypothetical protein
VSATLVRSLARAKADLVSLLLRDQMPSDPVRLAEALGLVPDDWQAGVLRSTAKRLLLNCCRQSGKSTTTAILALHTALYVPDSMVLMASPGLRQSSELFRKCLGFYRRLGRPIPSEAETRLQLELTNGSRVVSLPGNGDTSRGFSAVSLLLVDEASRVEDEMLGSLRPMLAVSGGRMVAMSTPAGRRGWWFEAWQDGGESWQRVQVTAEQCPRISSAFLEDERKALGHLVFDSEYLCIFHDALTSVFRSDDIRAALDSSVLPLFEDLITGNHGGSGVLVA